MSHGFSGPAAAVFAVKEWKQARRAHEQGFRLNGFGQIIVGPGPKAGFDVLVLGRSGNNDDGCLFRLLRSCGVPCRPRSPSCPAYK